MAQITEDYCSFETAKLLKEKGFDEETPVNYFVGDDKPRGCVVGEMIRHKRAEEDMHLIACPTLWMAMKWLREVHHYYIQVMLDSWAYGGHSGYYVTIQKTNSEFEIMLADKVNKVFYDNPEEAAEAAIKYILENFI